MVSAIRVTQMRKLAQLITSTPHPTQPNTQARCELDSHADTTCFGSNFVPIGWTDMTCTVSPYTEEYEAKTDVPIAHAATAYDDPVTGETTLLLFYHGLWFGSKLQDSLINPNQCRSFGIDICDDPWDQHRGLRIRVPEEGFEIPLNYAQNVTSFQTRAPTEQEIDTCYRVDMTSHVAWDPATIGAPKLSQEEEARKRIVGKVKIDSAIVEKETALLASDESEFDILLNDCSSVYSEKVLTQKLIAAVKIASEYSSSEEPNEKKISAVGSEKRHSRATPEEIARKFGCGLEAGRKTLKATTNFGVRTATDAMTRRYRTNLMQMKHRRLNAIIYNDTMFSKTKSLLGNKSAEVFTDGSYVTVKPTPDKTGTTVANALGELVQEIGIPRKMVTDDAKEKLGPNTKWMETIRHYKMDWSNTEPYSHWQNRAEDAIREVRRRWKLLQHRRMIPKRLWDYGLTYVAEIMCRTVRAGSDRTPYEILTGDTPDISEFIDFDFYDWVWYLNNPNDKESPPQLGRWLGVSHRVGSAMCYFVLTQNGTVLSRSSVQPVTIPEQLSDDVRTRMEKYDLEINGRLADEKYISDEIRSDVLYLEDDDPTVEGEEESPILEADEVWENNAYDQYVNAEILLPVGDGRMSGTVKGQKRDSNGNLIGKRNMIPMMDTRLYEVELADGTVRELFANNIAECMFSEVDSEGHSYRLLKEISDHRKDQTAIDKEHGMFRMNNRDYRKRTTKGWQLLVEWKEGSSDWVPLKDLKESYPVQVAEYAKANKIDDEPAFAWWIGDVLRKRNTILSKVKSRYWKTTHKFGIRIPKTVKEALEIDQMNNNDFWRKAIEKEMGKINSMGTFERWDGGSAEDIRSGKVKLPGFREISCHMIFDIKMDGKFTRKARYVADGNKTGEVPTHLTYSSVVTRESVRIAFLYAGLNGLNILGCDVTNAYLNAPCKEKIWVAAGLEFGDDLRGACMIIRKALYGLKSSGYSWRKTLSETLFDMKYESTVADPDVYRRRSSRANGEHYWEFVLTYVDDILCVSEKPEATMDVLSKVYALRDKAVEPDRYLGANVAKVQLDSTGEVPRTAWSMSSNDYVKGAIDIVKEMLAEDKRYLKTIKGNDRPMSENYRPEEDTSPELEPELASRYQQLIGMLRWACELGRVDILLETALLSSHLCMPRVGHLEAVYKIFAYLENHKQSNMIFDPRVVELNETAFQKTDWTDSVYGKVTEEIPPNAPEPLGKPVHMTCFVDANHAGETKTRRSQTGFIIFLNNAPIEWYSKKQNTCESSTFGSEFVAMRIAVEKIRALRYKLRMFGIPIAGPTAVLGDNESVVNSASKMDARLNKKHNAICFHTVREASAAGWIRVGWEPTATNIADLFTKMLPTAKRREHLQKIFVKKVKMIFGKSNGS